MDSPAHDTGPLTTIVNWRVLPGGEKEFGRHDMSAATLEFPGHMGVDVIRPAGDGRDYVVVFRFDNYEHLRAWQESDIRREMLKRAEPFREREPTYQTMSGLEYWFEAPGKPGAPPRWKQALVTVLGVWPLSALVPKLLHPLIGNLPTPLKMLFGAMGIVSLLTWVVMPLLVKLFDPWLHPRGERRG